jgi:hypothetical protein
MGLSEYLQFQFFLRRKIIELFLEKIKIQIKKMWFFGTAQTYKINK